MLLEAADFKLQSLNRQGLGGRVLVAKDANSCFYFKAENDAQSINEVLGQEYLKALGFPSVPTAWIRYKGKIYGALSELEGKRIQYFGELFFMNLFLENSDAGEFFECQDGLTRCLDLGEAIAPVFYVQCLIKGFNVPIPSSDIVATLSIAYKVGCDFGTSEDGMKALVKVQNYDEARMSHCFEEVEQLFGKELVNLYKHRFQSLKDAAAQLLKNSLLLT